MSFLDDFLHHGTLPFAGRDAELERLLAFWRATPYSGRLRASLVQAEAGIGKSRLLEEAIRRITGEEGVVVHAKLYPESSVSLAPLLARALWRSNVGRELLRTEPEESLASVIGALRRLGRLRPTLLVLEDTHLLASESVPELSALLTALADETLAVLALCRPSEWRGRTVLEGFLVERLELEGLSREAIAEIWRSLFGAPAEASIVEMLHAATLGNALALRSGLRTAIESRIILRDGDAWRLSDRAGTFAALMQRNVELLSAGMVAHLNDAELGAASALALLGEVFSREAAEAIVADFDAMLDPLMKKGVLATTSILSPPLGGIPPRGGVSNGPTFPSSAQPLLVFTHTLLHKHLVERARVDVRALTDAIADGHPLYSLLPFILLERHAPSLRDEEKVRRAVERALYVAWLLDQGFDSRAGITAWRCATALFAIVKENLDAAERERQELRHLQIKVSLLRFTTDGSLTLAAREFNEATRHSRIADIMPFRLSALAAYVGTHRDSEEVYIEAWRELLRIAGEQPEYHLHRSYIKGLGTIAQLGAIYADHDTLHALRLHVDEAIAGATDEQRWFIEWIIYPPYLSMYTSLEELEDRMRLYRRLEGEGPHEGKLMGMYKIGFLLHTGQLAAVMKMADDVVRWYREQGVWVSMINATLDVIIARGAMGEELPAIAGELRRLLDESPIRDGETALAVAAAGAMIGLLRGEIEWGRATCATLAPEAPWHSGAILLAIARGDIAAAAAALDAAWVRGSLLDRVAHRTLGAMAAVVNGASDDRGAAIAQAIGLLRPMLHLHDLLRLGALLAMGMMMERSESNAILLDRFHDAARLALESALEWLAARDLPTLMEPLVTRFGGYLEEGRASAWSASIAAMRGKENVAAPVGERRVRVSMLGTIGVGADGDELAPLRGVRIRTLLGLMVADQMIGASLTPQEFVLLAGEDDDPELARKKRNMGVVRLREIMGADAILTDARTPRLNLAIVEVDLLRADDLVKRALAAAREGSWVRAHPLLVEALELTRGEVPFPTLYESFFEAARDDFEFRVRSAVLDVSGGLLREGDTGGAEEILRKAYAAMPDDEEIAELFEQALISRGNRVEAARVRMRSGESVG